jgi:hypothetical protein
VLRHIGNVEEEPEHAGRDGTRHCGGRMTDEQENSPEYRRAGDDGPPGRPDPLFPASTAEFTARGSASSRALIHETAPESGHLILATKHDVPTPVRLLS